MEQTEQLDHIVLTDHIGQLDQIDPKVRIGHIDKIGQLDHMRQVGRIEQPLPTRDKIERRVGQGQYSRLIKEGVHYLGITDKGKHLKGDKDAKLHGRIRREM